MRVERIKPMITLEMNAHFVCFAASPVQLANQINVATTDALREFIPKSCQIRSIPLKEVDEVLTEVGAIARPRRRSEGSYARTDVPQACRISFASYLPRADMLDNVFERHSCVVRHSSEQ
jgi:hypothetical protein